MSDQQRTIFIIILSCLISFAFGLMIGLSPNSKPAEKEIIELNIELTKLKIKRIKGCRIMTELTDLEICERIAEIEVVINVINNLAVFVQFTSKVSTASVENITLNFRYTLTYF